MKRRMQWHPGPAIPSWMDALGWPVAAAVQNAQPVAPLPASTSPCPLPTLLEALAQCQTSSHWSLDQQGILSAHRVLSHPWGITPAEAASQIPLPWHISHSLRLFMLFFTQQMGLCSDAKALLFLPEFFGITLSPFGNSVQSNITATLPRLWDPKKEVWGLILLSQFIW